MRSLAKILGPAVFIFLSALALPPLAMGMDESRHIDIDHPDIERFDIDRFEVEGNTLLTTEEIESTLQPFTGKQREFVHLQRAVEALRKRYQKNGYTVVWVDAPEQDLDRGLVRLQVIEARIGLVTITGNRAFADANIRGSLPALMENTLPHAEGISMNIQLANQNPAKQVDVILRPGALPGVVDASVKVIDVDPLKIFTTLDNTGNDQTGDYRLGVGITHANLFDRDQIFTIGYITSPGSWEKTSLFSASYRVPLYGLGDSLDFVAAYSDVDVGTVQTVAGGLDFAGQGTVYSVRYNQLLARLGEYSHELMYGIDYRAFKKDCTLGNFGAVGCGPAALDVTITPISIAYSGRWARPGWISNFYVAVSENIPQLDGGRERDFNAVRPSPTGGRGAPSHYTIVRMGGSFVNAFNNNWQVRAAISAQYSPDALVSGEQFGLSGATTVRGFFEREMVRDTGHILNVELYSPNFAGLFLPGENNIRGLIFYDLARGASQSLEGELDRDVSIASAGFGLRWNIGRNFNMRFDLARIIDGEGIRSRGDTRGHVSLFLSI